MNNELANAHYIKKLSYADGLVSLVPSSVFIWPRISAEVGEGASIASGGCGGVVIGDLRDRNL